MDPVYQEFKCLCNIMQHDQKIIQVSEKVLFFVLFHLFNGPMKNQKLKAS